MITQLKGEIYIGETSLKEISLIELRKHFNCIARCYFVFRHHSQQYHIG